MPVDYKLGKIYKIVNDANTTIYVGSSAQKTLSARMGNHRKDAADLKRTSPLYTEMRQLGVERFKIILHHAFACNSKEELEAEENKTMNALKAAGTGLYNCIFDGKHAEESKEKMAKSQTGRVTTQETKEKQSAANLMFGCISLHGKSPTGNSMNWAFSWRAMVNGKMKQCSKTFAISKYGNFGAHFRAEEKRRQIYPEWGNECDNTCDDFGAIEHWSQD